jgi:hypothetical protein
VSDSRAERSRPSIDAAAREWVRQVADQARARAATQPRDGRRGKGEKERFALRAQHVKGLFRGLEQIAVAINKEAGKPLIMLEKALNPKNLGGIEVPDRARLVVKFLERRLELVVKPLVNIDGRPVPVGALAIASVIQYDPADPAGTDWYDLTLREDGTWVRKSIDPEAPQPPLGEKEVRRLVEWLVS